MQVKLNGVISIEVEGEWLFDGQPLPVTFTCDMSEDAISFDEADKVKMNFNVPVELCISESEWQRAVGEVLARALTPAAS